MGDDERTPDNGPLIGMKWQRRELDGGGDQLELLPVSGLHTSQDVGEAKRHLMETEDVEGSEVTVAWQSPGAGTF